MSLTKERWIFILRLVLLLLYVGVAWGRLDHYAWSYDEGVLLQTAVLAHADYPLYSETVFNKPPHFVWWLEGAFGLLGVGLWQARTAVLLLTAAGLWLLGSLAKAWWGAEAGVAAMVAYLLIPETLVRAGVVMNDLPALTLMLAALWAATRYQQTTRWGWAAGAGLLYGLGIGLHPMLLFMVVPLAMLLAWQPEQGLAWRHVLRSGLIAGGTAVLVTLLWLPLVDWAGFWEWVVEYNRAPVDALLQERTAKNPLKLWEYQVAHGYVVQAGLLGLLLLGWYGERQKRTIVAVIAVFYLLTVGTLLTLQPMWDHYRLFSLVPLLLFFAGGWAEVLKGQTAVWQPVRLLFLLSTLLFVFRGVTAAREWPTPPDGFDAAVAALQSRAAPDSFVISDNPYLLFVSGMRVPPPLADGSQKRISAGLLHPATVLQNGWSYGAEQFVVAFRRFELIPQLQPWLLRNGQNQVQIERFVVGELPPLPEVETAVGATFNEVIRLEGVTLSVEAEGATAVVAGTLFWETAVALPTDYKRFVHLLDEGGNLVAQHDSHPQNGLLFTSHWVPEQPLADSFRIELPPDLPAGQLTVGVGLYTEADLVRLPARLAAGEAAPHDVVAVGQIELP